MQNAKILSINNGEADSVVFANVDMGDSATELSLAAGDAIVYVQRAPDKQTENEDSAGVFSLGKTDCALAVADGMGGMPCGAQASKLVVESLQQAFTKARASEFGYREPMLNGIDEAHNAIAALGVGAGSTLAAVEIFDHVLRPYHVGDSIILVVGQRGKIKAQTIMHSPVGYAVESGMLDEHEAMHHDERHVISNYLGHSEMRIEIGPPVKLSRYDTVLVASDGLFDNLHIDEIVEIIRKDPLPKVCQKLVSLCENRMHHEEPGHPSKPDDMSFIVFRRNK